MRYYPDASAHLTWPEVNTAILEGEIHVHDIDRCRGEV